MEKTIRQYFDYLAQGNYEGLMTLFVDDAQVQSPLYGKQTAANFFRDLLADTRESVVAVKHIWRNVENGTGVVHFSYLWTLLSGITHDLDVVDIFSFDEHDRIKELVIIYDTQSVRVNPSGKVFTKSRH